MIKFSSKLVIPFILVFILSVIGACSSNANAPKNGISESNPFATATVSPLHTSVPTTTPKPVTPVTTKFTLTAVGDILLHKAVYRDAAMGTDSYDFRPMFEQVKPYLEQADITFANSESIIAGKELGISDYPQFGSPVEIGEALKSVGVDIVSMANNHTLDKKEKGVLAAIQNWNSLGVQYTGAYESQADRDRIRVIDANGVKVAFLSYTYGTNGIPVPEGKPYLVSLLDKEVMSKEIRKAKEVADVVVASHHFGVEYQLLPNDEQKDWATFAANEGADIILGHHPHVLQPVDWITRPDGSKAFVIYSLGNFIAAQELQEPYRYIGGILTLEVEKEQLGDQVTIKVQSPSFMPTYIDHKKWGEYKIIPLSHVTEQSLAGINGLRASIEERMKKWVPDMKIVNPTP